MDRLIAEYAHRPGRINYHAPIHAHGAEPRLNVSFGLASYRALHKVSQQKL